jgi:glucose-6-phosphate isomerase
VLTSLYNDACSAASASCFARFTKENVLGRLRDIDALARRGGLAALDSADPLVRIGVETGASGEVTKNSYGVLNLAWRAKEHPEWASAVGTEVESIRAAILATHGSKLRFLLWAGMGGSIEDKSMYNALGLLKGGPRFYALDSTDPVKLKSILDDMTRRSGLPLPMALRGTLVVGMAMGMTSYEPVVNLEKLSVLYRKYKIDSRPNFVYMTLPGSLLDRFAEPLGYRRIPLQLDGENSTAGRHSGPLTRGSLYPLALAGVNLERWIRGTDLSDEEVHAAWKLSAFLHAQGEAGRDKITLLLPKSMAGAGLWTKQDFEESLGKSEAAGIKVAIGERPKASHYRDPSDSRQDRVFLCVQTDGVKTAEGLAFAAMRRLGYPCAAIKMGAGDALSRYMQFVHYAVCGLGYLRNMNFVTQPSVELYKAITNRIYSQTSKTAPLRDTRTWKQMHSTPRRAVWKKAVTLYYDQWKGAPPKGEAPAIYAGLLKQLAAERKVEYGELTFFGDTRYAVAGRAVRAVMERAAEALFRARLKMPADVYEGPAMNHSYHEMIIGHGRCFSTVLVSEKQERIPAAGYGSDYHMAQYLATALALAEKGRFAVRVAVKDLTPRSLEALDEFFREAARALRP